MESEYVASARLPFVICSSISSLEKVVLITGLAAPAIIFKDLVDRLTKDGFQVLVYGAALYFPGS
jgi:hypothetical protein